MTEGFDDDYGKGWEISHCVRNDNFPNYDLDGVRNDNFPNYDIEDS